MSQHKEGSQLPITDLPSPCHCGLAVGCGCWCADCEEVPHPHPPERDSDAGEREGGSTRSFLPFFVTPMLKFFNSPRKAV